MLITIRMIALATLLGAGPAAASTPPADVVAEALFLCDTVPPGGRDLGLSVGVARGEPDPVTGEAPFVASPRLQLALALGERVGVTADVGFGAGGDLVDAPGASLKILLRPPGAGRTGLAASVDLFGSAHHPLASEAGLGLGAIRSFGRVTLRAGASAASAISGWSPHLHAGTSAAVALGAWRVLGEVVGELAGGAATWAAGPTVKLAATERTALAAGALVPLAGGAPTFTVQLTQAL